MYATDMHKRLNNIEDDVIEIVGDNDKSLKIMKIIYQILRDDAISKFDAVMQAINELEER
jgi:hypothetical protein